MPTGVVEVARIRTALAGRYRIERVLGEGGMATVYLAEDLKHQRMVAVKVMRPELAATLGSERFLREVAIAARLSHPHILAVHDSGSVDGLLYYVMPLVEGESLPARLAREKQLPVADALQIAREVAEALAYAHQRGIIHRDIKPANILLSAGHALVADFGIARATGDDTRALTQTGLAIGTPQYMSPEQASGDPTVDGRTDVYALGAVLYEMLAGEPPFTGPTAQAIITRSITEPPRPLHQSRAALPVALTTAVQTALAKAPADRFASAAAMADALRVAENQVRAGVVDHPAASTRRGPGRGLLVAGAGLLVLALLGGAWWARGSAGGNTAHSVVVLPFESQGTPEEAYFADGIVDELRDKLARLDGLTVIASASADQYRDSPKTGPEIAKELHVDQVLTGKVRWGDTPDGTRRARVVTELVDGTSGAVTWRNSFDINVTDALAMQGRIASDVAVALGAVLSPRVAQDLAGAPTDNADAYQLYLKALAAPVVTLSDLRAGVGYLEQAVALDENFARAWTQLGFQLLYVYVGGDRSASVVDRAHAALAQAERLAPDSARTYVVASYTYRVMDNDTTRARAAMRRAWQIDSNNVEVLRAGAGFDLRDENYAGVFAKLSRAKALDPRSLDVLSQLHTAQVYLGDVDEARATAADMMALHPQDVSIVQGIILGHLAVGDTLGARAVLDQAKAWIPPVNLVAYFAGYQELAFLLTDTERELLFRLTPSAFDDDVAWWGQSLALAAYQQGDMVRARAYADSALAESKRQASATPDDPQLTALYADMLMLTGDRAEAERQIEAALAQAHRTGLRSDVEYVGLQAVRVYAGLGQAGRALDMTDSLMAGVSRVTRQRLRVDPLWRSFTGNPRFERMATGGIDRPVD
jgi:serine/threonine-protein kinase